MSTRAVAFRYLGLGLTALLVAFMVAWVLFIARGTTFGSAVHDPKDFLITLLNGVTAAGLYFVVASGFTLIFGLMRVVNMAHGAFFLLGGYVALKLQRHFVGEGWLVRPDERAGQPHALDRAGASSASVIVAARRPRRCSSSSCAGTRARSCARR